MWSDQVSIIRTATSCKVHWLQRAQVHCSTAGCTVILIGSGSVMTAALQILPLSIPTCLLCQSPLFIVSISFGHQHVCLCVFYLYEYWMSVMVQEYEVSTAYDQSGWHSCSAAVLQCYTRCMQQARICHVILSESDLKPCLHRDNNCQQMRLLRKSNTTYPFNLRALSTKQVTSLGFTDCGWLSADCRERSDESNIFWHFKLSRFSNLHTGKSMTIYNPVTAAHDGTICRSAGMQRPDCSRLYGDKRQ